MIDEAVRTAWERLVLAGGRGEADSPEDVARFWFGRVPRARFEVVDAMWLPTRVPCWGGHWARRVLDVDAIVARYFGELHQRAVAGELDDWPADPVGRLAWIIVLDQISRNIHRGTPAAFSNDERVLPIAEEGIARGEDRLFNPLARTLLYLPLMHHEDPALVRRCITLYEQSYSEARGLCRLVLKVERASGHRHLAILERFGRYPHRNEILGRESTEQERSFLTENFSTF